jgi:hypothetical protein
VPPIQSRPGRTRCRRMASVMLRPSVMVGQTWQRTGAAVSWSQRHDPREYGFDFAAQLPQLGHIVEPAGRMHLVRNLVHVDAEPPHLLPQGRRIRVMPETGGFLRPFNRPPQKRPAVIVA